MRLTTAALAAATALLTLTACGTDDAPETETPPPPYKITSQDKAGNKRDVTVEVDTTKGLPAVFDHVTKQLTEEAGYYIMINCSTGATAGADNRLANGQYAIGRMGSATTGLDEGQTEFTVNKGRTCPDN